MDFSKNKTAKIMLTLASIFFIILAVLFYQDIYCIKYTNLKNANYLKNMIVSFVDDEPAYHLVHKYKLGKYADYKDHRYTLLFCNNKLLMYYIRNSFFNFKYS